MPSIMSSGVSLAFALIRVPRGQACPSDEDVRKALAQDRLRLCQPERNGAMEYQLAGPYPVVVDGSELDEWVAWEK
jgi:hypothetical protein